VREIEQEVYAEPEALQQKDTKQTAAVDLSKRLNDLRSLNDASSLKGNFLCSCPRICPSTPLNCQLK
jgi:hypothetical protein